MVRKLLNNDLRQSRKIFLPVIFTLLGAVIVMNLILAIGTTNMYNVLVPNKLSNIIFSISLLVSFILFITTVILSISGLIKYLYTNIYNEYGYQLFTLPVSLSKILIVKVLVVLIWLFIIGISFFITIIVLYAINGDVAYISTMYKGISNFILDTSIIGKYLIVFANGVISIIASVVSFLFAGALVNTRYFQKARIFFAIAIFFIIDITLSLISFNFTFGQPANGLVADSFQSLFQTSAISELISIPYLLVNITSIFILGYAIIYLWKNKLELSN